MDDVQLASGEIVSYAEFRRRQAARQQALIELVVDEFSVVDQDTEPDELRAIARTIIGVVHHFDMRI